MKSSRCDCITIGDNNRPFEEYEGLLRSFGEDSEAYRDLQYSFVDLGGEKLDYPGLLDRVLERGRVGSETGVAPDFGASDLPSLAAVYLTSFLARRGISGRCVNLFQSEKAELAADLSHNPLCVAITTTFYVLNDPVTEIVRFVRSQNPAVKIIVGGPLIANHARNYHDGELATILADIGADIYVIESQGELALAEIVECLRDGKDWKNVPNTAYFEGSELHVNERVPENNSLDQDHIDWQMFKDPPLGSVLQTRTARSCAFNCSFCNYPTRAGKLTLASLATIEAELDAMHELGYVRRVVFIDDTFNVPLPRFKDICRLMADKNYGFEWFSYFRCSNSDDETFALMEESGCKGVFLGIESGSPQILEKMNKLATIEKYERGIERLREHNILTFASFIIGFPGETAETVSETVDFINRTRPDYYRAQLWYSEPGTPIQRRREELEINGEGFVWEHSTMNSLEAMDHIDRLFLAIDSSIWLPQWSFDFWAIPHVLSKGVSLDQLRSAMRSAHKLLALEIAEVDPHTKQNRQAELVDQMVRTVGAQA